jgi:predicted dehydrogenase
LTFDVDKLRLGIAGMGIGAAVHLPVFLSMPGVTVEGVAARRYEKAAEVARRFGVPRAFGSAVELLDIDLDAIVLALPPDANADAAQLAVQRQLAIFAEKPLAGTARAAERLAQTSAGLVTMTDFQFAELTTVDELKRQLSASVIGKLRCVNVAWLTESWAHKSGQWHWKLSSDHRGGVMSMLGSHLLYLVEHLLGKIDVIEATCLNAANRALAPAGATAAEDTALIHIRLINGLSVSVNVSNAAHNASIHRWELVGDDGTLELVNRAADPVAGFTLLRRDQFGQEFVLATENVSEGVDSRSAPFRRMAQRFVDGVRTGAAVYPNFLAGARVQQLLEVVSASSRSGKPVRVP